MKKYLVTVKNGRYAGRKGYCLNNKPNEIGCIMWYSEEGKFPYRAVLHFSDIQLEG